MSRPTPRQKPAGRPAAAGLVVGSMAHKILLALRAGPMTGEQFSERFPNAKHYLPRLIQAGLLQPPADKGLPYRITATGREAVAPGGPLARARTLITYCQL